MSRRTTAPYVPSERAQRVLAQIADAGGAAEITGNYLMVIDGNAALPDHSLLPLLAWGFLHTSGDGRLTITMLGRRVAEGYRFSRGRIGVA